MNVWENLPFGVIFGWTVVADELEVIEWQLFLELESVLEKVRELMEKLKITKI